MTGAAGYRAGLLITTRFPPVAPWPLVSLRAAARRAEQRRDDNVRQKCGACCAHQGEIHGEGIVRLLGEGRGGRGHGRAHPCPSGTRALTGGPHCSGSLHAPAVRAGVESPVAARATASFVVLAVGSAVQVMVITASESCWVTLPGDVAQSWGD
jgi:hypothetical protein